MQSLRLTVVSVLGSVLGHRNPPCPSLPTVFVRRISSMHVQANTIRPYTVHTGNRVTELPYSSHGPLLIMYHFPLKLPLTS